MKLGKDIKRSLIPMAYASTVGIQMLVMVFGGLFVGNWLDERYKTGSVFSLVFLILGVFAGFRNVYGTIKRYFRDETVVIKSIKNEVHRKRPAPDKN